MSQELLNKLGDVECHTEYNTCLSDHYPIHVAPLSYGSKIKSFWFHADTTLFKIPTVQQEVKNIWNKFFSLDLSPAKAWTLAVSSTQALLKCIQKEVRELKNQKSRKMYDQLWLLD